MVIKMKHSITIITLLFFALSAQGQKLDSSTLSTLSPNFNQYLNGLKEICQEKDTAKLHLFFGDNFFASSCWGNEKPFSNWTSFKTHYELGQEPKSSTFWKLFINLSKDGYYIDSITDRYSIPASNHLTPSNYGKRAIPDIHEKVFYKDTIIVYADSSLTQPSQTLAVKHNKFGDSYPYNFILINKEAYLCFNEERKLGFVSFYDVVYWELTFLFEQIDGKWQLSFLQICD
jgi:hypothetical protein